MAHSFQSSQKWSRSSVKNGQDRILCKAEKCVTFGEEEMFLFVENKSLHLPLTSGGTEGLPVLTDLDGVEVALLGLAGGSRTTGAGEDGGGDVA